MRREIHSRRHWQFGLMFFVILVLTVSSKSAHAGVDVQELTALDGKRLGLFGQAWTSEDSVLSRDTSALYQNSQQVLQAQGATLVSDPFVSSGFDALVQSRTPNSDGYASIVYYSCF